MVCLSAHRRKHGSDEPGSRYGRQSSPKELLTERRETAGQCHGPDYDVHLPPDRRIKACTNEFLERVDNVRTGLELPQLVDQLAYLSKVAIGSELVGETFLPQPTDMGFYRAFGGDPSRRLGLKVAGYRRCIDHGGLSLAWVINIAARTVGLRLGIQ